MQPKPIVYCETNWLVSLAFQHHHKYKEATDLLVRASAGEFDLRLPVTALIEAPRPIADEASSFINAWNTFRVSIQNAVENGYFRFDSISQTIGAKAAPETEVIKKLGAEYIAEQKARDVVRMITEHPNVQILNNPSDAIQTFSNIRHKVNFRGADTVDLFILAHVLADRAKEPPKRPAILLSLDAKAFDPKSGKVDQQFYLDNQLAWCSSFNYQHAKARWAKWFNPLE